MISKIAQNKIRFLIWSISQFSRSTSVQSSRLLIDQKIALPPPRPHAVLAGALLLDWNLHRSCCWLLRDLGSRRPPINCNHVGHEVTFLPPRPHGVPWGLPQPEKITELSPHSFSIKDQICFFLLEKSRKRQNREVPVFTVYCLPPHLLLLQLLLSEDLEVLLLSERAHGHRDHLCRVPGLYWAPGAPPRRLCISGTSSGWWEGRQEF